MKTIKILALFCILSFIAGCASKKHDTRLEGIQKQILYLTDSYNKLSLSLGEIQDSLLVLQYKVEEKSKISKSKTTHIKEKIKVENMRKIDKPVEKAQIEEKASNVPVFELGLIGNKKLAGKPGEIFRLDDGKGFIKIEGKGSSETILKEPFAGEIEKRDPKELYKTGFTNYSKRKFTEAIATFSLFLKYYPEHDLSDNATYWIGESYFGKGQYSLALPEFQRIPLEFPNGNKVPDAMLMIGMCFDKLNNKENAKQSWTKLVKLFPKSMAAKRANKKLETF